ncbi:lipid A ethanolaminephosphotransferase [Janthinobacterium sp. CG_23.3]|uniref:phosphoethanolamine transferase n=1 Tax=Janthinobacterium sp. CG_23.3 TaxID=3349634 RepID=UPI0038D4A807
MPSRIDASVLPLAASVLFVSFYNVTFWKNFFADTGGIHLANIPLHIGMFLLLVLLFNASLTLFNFRFIIKPLLVALFLATAGASYFMDQYGTPIDWSMVQNVVETDAREGAELLSWKMLPSMLLLGVLPSLALLYADVRFPRRRRHAANSIGAVAASLAVAAVLLLLLFKSLAPAMREHRELRFLLTPSNYIQAVNGYLKRKWSLPLVVAPLGTDAVKGVAWAGAKRKTVTVIVVGETARAMNFSLNHYARDTNPLLSRQAGLLNFHHMQSCGTATAVSVPCVFSALGRQRYSDERARSQEGLLDVLSHAGLDVLWRDNNSGCKGVCARVKYEDLSQPAPGDPLCNDEDCYDERLLRGLPEIIRNASGDMVIVLHQKGSHGPSYWKRYPAAFKHFGPQCETNELAKCSTEAIVAAYDNSIRYTDYVLSKAIALLERSGREDNVDTALVYFSDHGESLGENNLYLHGAPYVISPPEQRRVPFMLWLSDGFRQRFGLDQRCLAARADQEFSHDNIFHSTLGMLNISTSAYNPKLDLFHACSHAI